MNVSPADLRIRAITATDNAAVAALIREVMPSFGAIGPGFAITDPEVDDMAGAYAAPRSAYFVVTHGERVVGGGGYAALVGGDGITCELRKMYFQPEARGHGVGRRLLVTCLEGAARDGFERMYLETLEGMTRAIGLYEKSGFLRIPGPLGATGHFGCDRFYARDLRDLRV
ncbi:MAG: acetyltransferase [Labilithrix sp.]|nr:acetyltransferase [Labilithrix sp.]